MAEIVKPESRCYNSYLYISVRDPPRWKCLTAPHITLITQHVRGWRKAPEVVAVDLLHIDSLACEVKWRHRTELIPNSKVTAWMMPSDLAVPKAVIASCAGAKGCHCTRTNATLEIAHLGDVALQYSHIRTDSLMCRSQKMQWHSSHCIWRDRTG